MYRGIFLLSLRCCVCAVECLCCCVCAVVFVLLGLFCWVFVLLGLFCWVCAVGFVLLGLCCCVCAVGFVLLGLCCWVCAVVFVLLGLCCYICAVVFVLLGLCCWVCAVGCLCCWVYSVVSRILSAHHSRCCLFHCGFLIYAGPYAMVWFWTFSLLEASLCPISPINSITCFLISLDFGYISCFFLPYVHFSHHGLLVFLRHGFFWTFSLLEASLCPISPIDPFLCFLIFRYFGYISCFFLPYVHFSHHGLLVFLRHGFFLDIFASWSFIMSNISHRPYHLFPDFPWFWIYFLFFTSLCPFFSS